MKVILNQKVKYHILTLNDLDLLCQHVLSPIGQETCLHTNTDLSSTFSVTVLTTLDPMHEHPILLLILEKILIQVFLLIFINKRIAEDFLTLVKSWISLEYLKIRDYLIVDNAAVHAAECIREELSKVCNDAQVNL